MRYKLLLDNCRGDEVGKSSERENVVTFNEHHVEGPQTSPELTHMHRKIAHFRKGDSKRKSIEMSQNEVDKYVWTGTGRRHSVGGHHQKVKFTTNDGKRLNGLYHPSHDGGPGVVIGPEGTEFVGKKK